MEPPHKKLSQVLEISNGFCPSLLANNDKSLKIKVAYYWFVVIFFHNHGIIVILVTILIWRSNPYYETCNTVQHNTNTCISPNSFNNLKEQALQIVSILPLSTNHTIHLRCPWTSAFFRLASGNVGFSPRLKNSGHVITFLRRGGLQNTDHVMPFWPFKVDSLSHVFPAFVKVQRKERCPLYNLQSKQVKRFSHEWINNFIIANLISGIT